VPLDDDDFETSYRGAPLPPDDRLWRHPSELSSSTAVGRGSSASQPKLWAIAGVAGLVGATLALGVVAAVHGLDHTVERTAVERVPVSQAVIGVGGSGDEAGVADLTEQVAPAVVRIVAARAPGGVDVVGSGFVYRDDGYVITSARLLGPRPSVSVVLDDGTELEAEVIGVDPTSDVAVVKVDMGDLPTAVLGVDTAVRVGDAAVAIGAPVAFPGSPFVSVGVVSAVGQRIDLGHGSVLHGLIQTDVPVKATAPGGPLCDATGTVIGLSTSIASPDGDFGYAVAIELAMAAAHDLVEHGEVRHVWLGIEGGDLTAADRERLGVESGARVGSVVEGGPAAQAGLAIDDVIVAVDGRAVDAMSSLVVTLRVLDPGDTVTVDYVRAGTRHTVEVTLVERAS
jgi:putative serine protease PepD